MGGSAHSRQSEMEWRAPNEKSSPYPTDSDHRQSLPSLQDNMQIDYATVELNS